MKEKNQLIIAIVAVLMIIGVVGGSTYAYWTWASAANEQTSVTFSVTAGGLSASLTGTSQTVTNLIPVSSCLDANYAIKKELTLTYTNETTVSAKVFGNLAVGSFTSPHGTPDAEDLGHLHYVLSTSSNSCSDAGVIKSGTFTSTTGNLFTNVELATAAVGAKNATKKLYLYVWLDNGYTHQNVGSGVVNDPMQDISFSLTWSGSITNAQ